MKENGKGENDMCIATKISEKYTFDEKWDEVLKFQTAEVYNMFDYLLKDIENCPHTGGITVTFRDGSSLTLNLPQE